ncbi:MAG: DUF86 domain-containing protein [Candidatus Bathyarchaeia archaeon]
MKKDCRLYIDDILEASNKIGEYTKRLNFSAFSNDSKTVDAVVRNFEIIGEATKRLPAEVKARNPQVPWRMMTGTRDKLIHDYSGVNLDVLWKAVKEDIPALKPVYRAIAGKDGSRIGRNLLSSRS